MTEAEVKKPPMEIMVDELKKQFSFILSPNFAGELAKKLGKLPQEVKDMSLEEQLKEVINLRREQLKNSEPYIRFDVKEEITGEEGKEIVLIPVDRIIGCGHYSINKWGDIDPKKLETLVFFAAEIVNSIKQGDSAVKDVINRIFNVEMDQGKSIRLGKYEGVNEIYFVEDGNHRVLFATIFDMKYIPARINNFKVQYEHSFKSGAGDKLEYNKYPSNAKKVPAVREFANSRNK